MDTVRVGLADTVFVVLGAGAELGPYRALLNIGLLFAVYYLLSHLSLLFSLLSAGRRPHTAQPRSHRGRSRSGEGAYTSTAGGYSEGQTSTDSIFVSKNMPRSSEYHRNT
jgi:hypothetical protein